MRFYETEDTQTYILGGWEEGGTVDGGGKVTQESTRDTDGAMITAKKKPKNRQMQTKTRLMKKESRKNHALLR